MLRCIVNSAAHHTIIATPRTAEVVNVWNTHCDLDRTAESQSVLFKVRLWRPCFGASRSIKTLGCIIYCLLAAAPVYAERHFETGEEYLQLDEETRKIYVAGAFDEIGQGFSLGADFELTQSLADCLISISGNTVVGLVNQVDAFQRLHANDGYGRFMSTVFSNIAVEKCPEFRRLIQAYRKKEARRNEPMAHDRVIPSVSVAAADNSVSGSPSAECLSAQMACQKGGSVCATYQKRFTSQGTTCSGVN